jgi:DNA polymerase I
MSIPGLTAQVVGLLRDYRVKIYKKRAKDKSLPEEQRAWYNTVQAAMKVYINASYGVFGAESFPFYAPPLAESVTAIGRYIIRQSLQKAAELGLFVLYGDTDSLFLWHPDRASLKELQDYVNEKFGLDIEVDKVYRFVTFSGLKKNYIGVYEDGGVDVKGLVAKKRNTPEFLKKEFSDILKMIGAIESPESFIKIRAEILNKLREIYNNIRNLEYNLDELAVKMALNKPLEAYTKNTPQHVKAARQLAALGIQVLPGDVISFVKVRGKEGVKPIQLARLAEIDVDKYVDTMKGIFEQILAAFNMTWDEVLGSRRLEAFFKT